MWHHGVPTTHLAWHDESIRTGLRVHIVVHHYPSRLWHGTCGENMNMCYCQTAMNELVLHGTVLVASRWWWSKCHWLHSSWHRKVPSVQARKEVYEELGTLAITP